MRHISDLELERWRDAGPGVDRERVIAHLAECAGCAARYADVIRRRAPQVEEASDAADFIAAGLDIPHAAPASRTRGVTPWLLGLAAAAVVLLAIVMPRWNTRERGPAPALTFRGAGVRALSPAGPVARDDLRFVWSSGMRATRFRVDVGEGDAVLGSVDATESGAALPASLRDRLQPGASYWWTVTALDANNASIGASDRREFSLSAR
jgi:hypothetical protein